MTHANYCYHCHRDVDIAVPTLEVSGKPQGFCCMGCHAVCQAIYDANLEDYYQYRTTADMEAAAVPDSLVQYKIYDDANVQQSFVQDSGDNKEAFLLIENIHCAACYWLNEKHVQSQVGVREAVIDINSNKMRVVWNPELTSFSAILESIASIGYVAYPYNATHSKKLDALKKRRSLERIIFAGLIGMAVMQLSIATYLLDIYQSDGTLKLWVSIGRITSLFAVFVLLAYPAQDFFIGAYTDIKNKRIGMDVPIVLGLSIAFLGSVAAVVAGHGEVYFDSIAMFVFFILLARHWEMKARVKATASVDKLTITIPQYAQCLAKDGKTWTKTALVDVQKGDIVRVKAGEKVCVDGKIIQGSSSFDESILTGESLPVYKNIGDEVFSGATNHEQMVWVEVTKTGTDTTVNAMSVLIGRALETKPKIARSVDTIAQWFVPLIVLLAVGTAGYGYATGDVNWLGNTIAVLIVTCPCALALATPIALTVGMGELIHRGILPSNMARIETLANIDTVVFDKTGTLTEGKLSLQKAIFVHQAKKDIAVSMASNLAEHSEHVVARALHAAYPHIEKQPLENFHNHVGQGVSATLDGVVWKLGSLGFVENDNEEIISAYKAHTISALSCDGTVMAYFVFQDTLRTNTQAMVDALKHQGITDIHILSGDNLESVRHVAETLGIENCHANMLPNDKLDWMHKKQATGATVLMVGDGVNDAPTLAAADVSLSFAEASAIAQSQSDFVIGNSNIMTVDETIKYAKRMQRIIKQNLIWALAYNLIMIPLAIIGWVPPYVAAIGMSLSSLVVVFNALRL